MVDAGDHQRNVMVVITQTRCAPCRKMEPLIVQARNEGYLIYVFNIDTEGFEDYDAKFDTRKTPTFITYEGGQEIDRFTGRVSYDRLVAHLKKKSEQTDAGTVPAPKPDSNPYGL